MTTLDRYVGAAASKVIALVAATLTTLFTLFEFVEQLRSVGTGNYRLINALVFVSLTFPHRLLQLAPAAVLLGSLLALGGLARNSELLALQSLGISEFRIVAPIFKLAVLLVIGLFLLAEFVIPPAQQLAQSQRLSALSSAESIRRADSVWAHRDYQYLSVQEIKTRNIPENIDIYEFAPDGDLKTIIHADSADIQGDGTWLLSNVLKKSVNLSQFQSEHLESLTWPVSIPTDLLVLPPESLSPIALYRYVRELKQRHQAGWTYEFELWAKASIPLTMVAFIMMAPPFVFGSPRVQSSGRQITIGSAIGIVFSLCQQITRQLALLFGLDPLLSALAPSLALMALALYLFLCTQR